MLIRPVECRNCALDDIATGFSRPEGSGANGVLAVGEGLGRSEAHDGLPFRPFAEAGSVLERAFRHCGLSREQFRLWNIIACRPPHDRLEGTGYEIDAIEHCRVHFDRVVAEMKPRCLLALGNVALRTLTGMAGRYQTITHVRGYVLHSPRYGIPVVATLHPSYVRRTDLVQFRVLVQDIGLAVQVAADGCDQKRINDYNEYPSVAEARAFLARVRVAWIRPALGEHIRTGLLTYDIETMTSKDVAEDERDEDTSWEITQIQFSLAPGTGIAFPWEEPYISIAREIFAVPIRKAGFNNWGYDDPRLRRYAIKIAGENHDLMWAWHHLQPDLPANLQFVASFYGMDAPWKHLGESKPRYYGCCDVDAPQRIAAKIFDDLRKRGVERGYNQHVFKLWPVLVKAADRGVPVNDQARKEFAVVLDDSKKKVYAEMQAIVPDEVRKIHPTLGYKREPKEVVEARAIWTTLRRTSEATAIKLGGTPTDPYPGPEDAFVTKQTGLVRRTFIDDVVEVTCPYCGGAGRTERQAVASEEYKCQHCKGRGKALATGKVERWCRLKPFVPSGGSNGQLIRYMKFRGHPVPRDFKKDVETTAKVELERLARKTKDSLYPMVLQYREFEKMKSTYVDGWAPSDIVEYKMFDVPQVVLAGAEPTSTTVVSIGRVHTTFTFRPATGQLSSRGPNIQNAPKHEGQRAVPGLAHAFRRIIEAQPGHRIVSFDYKSFHALTLGFEAGDPDYMRLARLDIHSFLAAHILKLEGCDNLLARSDDELREYFRWLKSDPDRLFTRDFKAKRAILGYGFGLGYRKLYDMNQEAFTRQAEAKRTIEMLNRAFPRTAQFRNTIRNRAHRDTFLLTRHGCIRHFFDVYRWDARYGTNRPGRDSEKAIAYLPANDAFGHIKDAMLRLEDSGWNQRANFFNQIHDDLMFEIPDGVFDEAVPAILAEMVKPSEILIDPVTAPDGLQCAVEVKVGRTWEKMEELRRW